MLKVCQPEPILEKVTECAPVSPILWNIRSHAETPCAQVSSWSTSRFQIYHRKTGPREADTDSSLETRRGCHLFLLRGRGGGNGERTRGSMKPIFPLTITAYHFTPRAGTAPSSLPLTPLFPSCTPLTPWGNLRRGMLAKFHTGTQHTVVALDHFFASLILRHVLITVIWSQLKPKLEPSGNNKIYFLTYVRQKHQKHSVSDL